MWWIHGVSDRRAERRAVRRERIMKTTWFFFSLSTGGFQSFFSFRLDNVVDRQSAFSFSLSLSLSLSLADTPGKRGNNCRLIPHKAQGTLSPRMNEWKRLCSVLYRKTLVWQSGGADFFSYSYITLAPYITIRPFFFFFFFQRRSLHTKSKTPWRLCQSARPNLNSRDSRHHNSPLSFLFYTPWKVEKILRSHFSSRGRL